MDSDTAEPTSSSYVPPRPPTTSPPRRRTPGTAVASAGSRASSRAGSRSGTPRSMRPPAAAAGTGTALAPESAATPLGTDPVPAPVHLWPPTPFGSMADQMIHGTGDDGHSPMSERQRKVRRTDDGVHFFWPFSQGSLSNICLSLGPSKHMLCYRWVVSPCSSGLFHSGCLKKARAQRQRPRLTNSIGQRLKQLWMPWSRHRKRVRRMCQRRRLGLTRRLRLARRPRGWF